MIVESRKSHTASALTSVGLWESEGRGVAFDSEALCAAALRCREPVAVVQDPQSGRVGVGFEGRLSTAGPSDGARNFPCLGVLPALYPEWLGERAFTEAHGLRFAYVAGAMARGITTTDIVIEMAEMGAMGFFGSAGLALPEVDRALGLLNERLGDRRAWGCNLIHSPNEPELEQQLASLLIQRDVRRVSASAYMSLTPAIVHYAFSGTHVDASGRLVRPRHVFAKISRPEVARHFMAPPDEEMLRVLVQEGKLTSHEADCARHLPVAEDITVEADSGGHTDNQHASALFPIIKAMALEHETRHGYHAPLRVGLAGGLGTPAAVAAAFSMGAAYVLTGSVNQGAVESGVSQDAKELLANARLDDVAMAPSADMFELGVKVQVLKRGTMFSVRAGQLYDLYRQHASLEDIPKPVRDRLESQVFRRPLDEIWQVTRDFWSQRNAEEVARADQDPRHKMALVFRWYLGMTSRWPLVGEADRQIDYQLWCGPAMGSFNDWVRGSFLEAPSNRTVQQIARNLLEGAAVHTRAQQLRCYGAPMPTSAFAFSPRPLE